MGNIQCISYYNSWISSKLNWKNHQFRLLLPTVKKMQQALIACIDKLVQSATLEADSTGSSNNPYKLSDLQFVSN